MSKLSDILGSPQSAAGVGTSGTIAGAGISAGGSLFSGFAESGMYDYQSAVAKINAQIAEQNATTAIWSGERQAQNYGQQAAQRFGQIVASQGASGVDAGSGSAKDVQTSQREITAQDLSTIRASAAHAAYGFDVQATQFQNQAKLFSSASATSMISGGINAVSSIVGGAGSVASKWMQGSQVGLNSGSVETAPSTWAYDTDQLGAG